MNKNLKLLVASIVSCTIFCHSINAQVNVLTNHNDFRRLGWNKRETQLNTNTVKPATFCKIFSKTVDDQIYAQPLVVSNTTIAGGIHTIVIAATVNNSVYAFDADSGSVSDPYWQINLTPNGSRPVKNTDMTGACGGNYKDFSGNMGIVGTPAIDTVTNTLYVVARSVTTSNTTYQQYLHAIDLTTGQERPNSPMFITATVSGGGTGSFGGVITFDQQKQNQRPGLLLYNGTVYIGWASHCDWGPYHGWLLGYDAATLNQKYVYNATPQGYNAGIWMSGQPPAVDENGYIYLATGNGSIGTSGNPNDPINRGESLIKLNAQLQLQDFFTPNNYQELENGDLDYGSSGVLLIPNSNLSLSGSKQGYIYLIDNTSMGGMNVNNTNVLQKWDISAAPSATLRHLHGSPVYFKNNLSKEYVYAWSENSFLKQIFFDRNSMLFDVANETRGTISLPNGMPGAMLAISSDQSLTTTGVLWASHPYNGNANQAVVSGILRAFDANDVTKELWNSNMNTGDAIGNFAKFVPPTIANGKVYMATFSNQLAVYGIGTPTQIAKRTPENPQFTTNGLDYKYYDGTFTSLPIFNAISPSKQGQVTNFDLTPATSTIDYAFQYKGFINVTVDGYYDFFTSSDDGSRLYIGNTLVVDNDGLHGSVENSGTIGLKAGKHAISVEFFQQGGNVALDVSYSGPGITKQLIPDNVLYRAIPIPVITVSSPLNNSVLKFPATVNIAIAASSTNGDIQSMQVFAGATLLNSVSGSVLGYNWTNMAIGNYTITGVATDIYGISSTTTGIKIKIQNNIAPLITLVSPITNANFDLGSTISINANAVDTDGTVAKVEFYANTTLIGVDVTSPYTLQWTPTVAGSYLISAIATDNDGSVTGSNVSSVNISTNLPPTISITSPINNSVFTNIDSLLITASAIDLDGSISGVNFFNGQTLLGTALTEPYEYLWKNIPAGLVSIVATATDNNNAVATSTSVNFQLNKNVTATVNEELMMKYPRPNPSENLFTYSVSKNIITASVYNELGKAVWYSKEASQGQILQFGQDFISGTYAFVIYFQDGSKQVFTLIKLK